MARGQADGKAPLELVHAHRLAGVVAHLHGEPQLRALADVALAGILERHVSVLAHNGVARGGGACCIDADHLLGLAPLERLLQRLEVRLPVLARDAGRAVLLELDVREWQLLQLGRACRSEEDAPIGGSLARVLHAPMVEPSWRVEAEAGDLRPDDVMRLVENLADVLAQPQVQRRRLGGTTMLAPWRLELLGSDPHHLRHLRSVQHAA